MFGNIIFRDALPGEPPLDVGALAEALLFYERVGVVASKGTLRHLLKTVKPFVLLSLLNAKRLEIYYLDEHPVVHTETPPNSEAIHTLLRISAPADTIQSSGMNTFLEAAGKSAQAKLGAKKFACCLVPLGHYRYDERAVARALTNQAATEASVRALLRCFAPLHPSASSATFRVELIDEGRVRIHHDLDLHELSQLYERVAPGSHLTEGLLVSFLTGTHAGAYYASTLEAGLAVSPMQRAMSVAGIESLVAQRERNEGELGRFQDVTLENSRAIREAINSGKVPFSEILPLLDRAEKFRTWLHGVADDSDLLTAYYREVMRDHRLDKAPAKVMRWAVMGGLGVAADVTLHHATGVPFVGGAAVAALDAFVVEKIARGWRPSMFVEGELRAFVDSAAPTSD